MSNIRFLLIFRITTVAKNVGHKPDIRFPMRSDVPSARRGRSKEEPQQQREEERGEREREGGVGGGEALNIFCVRQQLLLLPRGEEKGKRGAFRTRGNSVPPHGRRRRRRSRRRRRAEEVIKMTQEEEEEDGAPPLKLTT